jgi:hypothetical protein
MKRNGWNLETMNQYCYDNDIDYKIMDIKYVNKTYQIQLWSLVKCPNDEHLSYWVCWNNFLKANRCKLCHYDNANKRIWNIDDVKDFYSQYGLKILNINEWKNVDTPMSSIDNIGFKYHQSISNLKKFAQSKFHVGNPYSIDNIQLYCNIYRPDYKLISNKYKGIKELYQWEYIGDMLPDSIDKNFELTADNFINGGCGHPYFSQSKKRGEFIFEQYLINNKINYKKQKSFKGCKDKYLLKFDFYLIDTNEVIEIDGLQHTQAIEYWGGEDGFLDRKLKDEIKNNFCIKNNIKITRITYIPNKLESYKKLIDDKIAEILKQNKIAS